MKALMFNITVPNFLALRVLGRLSRKCYFDGPFATVRLRDVPEPDLPGEDWVKIRVRLCGFCGSDLNLLLVKDSPMASPFTSFPCIFGHEFCGDVVQAGRGVTACRAGDTVTVNPALGCIPRGIDPVCPLCAAGRSGSCERLAEGRLAPGMFTGICKDIGGGFAEYTVAHQSQIFRVPDGVSPESAMFTEPLAVGIQAVLDNPPADRDRVLVIGGGVIGTMIVKAMRGMGMACRITVAEPSAFHAGFIRHAGADQVVEGDLVDAALKWTSAKAYKPMLGPRIVQGGFDRVFDTVGHSETLQRALVVTAGRGTVSLVGIGPKIAFDPTPLWLKLQTIRGCYASGTNDTPAGRRHAFDIALEMMQSGKVPVEDMLTHTFPIEKYRDLIAVNMNKSAHRAVKTAVRFHC